MTPDIATRIFHTEGNGAIQLIENGDPIWVHGIVYTSQIGLQTLGLEDKDGNSVIALITNTPNAIHDAIWLADNGLQIAAAIGAGEFVTVVYRPTG